MAFDPNSPAESHAVLSGDIDQIRENFIQLRKHETGASEPSNLVAGMLWHDTNGAYLKIRKADNGSWLYVLLGTAQCTEGQILATPAEINKACDLTTNAFFTAGGTRKILLYEDVAPTGWTLQNTLDDKLVFVTKGSVAGGQTGGGVHSTGTWTQPDHTLTIAEMPAHDHNLIQQNDGASISGSGWITHTGTRPVASSENCNDTGGGGAHNHGTAWRPAAYNVIIAALD